MISYGLEGRRVGPLREMQSPVSLLGLGAAVLGGNRPRWQNRVNLEARTPYSQFFVR